MNGAASVTARQNSDIDSQVGEIVRIKKRVCPIPSSEWYFVIQILTLCVKWLKLNYLPISCCIFPKADSNTDVVLFGNVAL